MKAKSNPPSKDHYNDFLDYSKRVNAPTTTERYTEQVGRFIAFAKGRAEYSRKLVNMFLDSLITDGKTPISVSVYEKAVRSFYAWLHANEIIESNPLYGAKRIMEVAPRKEKQVFTEDEYQRILKVARDHLHQYWEGACLVAWHTGLRLSDVAQLQWDQVDFHDECISIVPQKIKKLNRMIHIPMPAELYRWLTVKKAGVIKSIYVEPDMAGSYKLDGNVYLSNEFSNICHKAGVKGKSFHTFRRTFNTRAIQSGVSPAIISQLTGQNIQTVMQYVNINMATKREAVMQMNQRAS